MSAEHYQQYGGNPYEQTSHEPAPFAERLDAQGEAVRAGIQVGLSEICLYLTYDPSPARPGPTAHGATNLRALNLLRRLQLLGIEPPALQLRPPRFHDPHSRRLPCPHRSHALRHRNPHNAHLPNRDPARAVSLLARHVRLIRRARAPSHADANPQHANQRPDQAAGARRREDGRRRTQAHKRHASRRPKARLQARTRELPARGIGIPAALPRPNSPPVPHRQPGRHRLRSQRSSRRRLGQ